MAAWLEESTFFCFWKRKTKGWEIMEEGYQFPQLHVPTQIYTQIFSYTAGRIQWLQLWRPAYSLWHETTPLSKAAPNPPLPMELTGDQGYPKITGGGKEVRSLSHEGRDSFRQWATRQLPQDPFLGRSDCLQPHLRPHVWVDLTACNPTSCCYL